MKPIIDTYRRLTPDIVGKLTVYRGINPIVAPRLIQPMFMLTASTNEMFFTSPVASLTKTGGGFEPVSLLLVSPDVTFHSSQRDLDWLTRDSKFGCYL
jgi:hypothetical protein